MRTKKLLEVVETSPGHLMYGQVRSKIPECNLQTPHGHVLENEKVEQRNQE